MALFSRGKDEEKLEKKVQEYFQTINAYTPAFRTFEGGLYEMELTRAAVHSFATHVSKLKPEVKGSGNEVLNRKLQYKPNALMDTKKYLYRLATIYSVNNNVFIAPLTDEFGRVTGFYPLLTDKVQIVKSNGVNYVRYDMGNGNYGAVELTRAGIMNQFQYKNELFGENNGALRSTLELMHTNNEGIIEGVKSSASIRFMAKLANVLKESDLEAERKKFTENNLSVKNNGGVMMFDAKYGDVKQINSTPYTVDPAQMQQIKENVFDYFGTNENILQNKFTSDEWSAYYEGKIEPFAIEASLVHTNMTFSDREIAFGNEIMFTANRLQYMSNAEKLSTVTQLFDRGFLTHNQGLEIFNMAPVEDGDKRYIRKEYALADYEEADALESEESDVEIDGENEPETV